MGNESSGGGGGGNSGGYSSSYNSSSYSGGTCPTSVTSSNCQSAQTYANNMCDRIGSNEGLGRSTPAGDISDGIRCLQAQAAADKACGK